MPVMLSCFRSVNGIEELGTFYVCDVSCGVDMSHFENEAFVVGYCVCRAGVNREVYLRTLLSGLKVTHYTLNV